MCPEVERRLRVEKFRSVSVLRGVSRREVLKGSLGLFLSPLLLFSSSSHALLSLDVFSWGCVKCEIGFCMCEVKGLGGIKLVPSISNKYWYPVGFIEINKACNFLTSLLPVAGETVGTLLGEICGLLPLGWIQQADMSQNVGIGKMGQQYMRVHARWYGMTPEIESAVSTYLETVELCPCSVLDAVKNVVLGPVYEKLSQLEQKINEYGKKLQKLKEGIDKVKQALNKFGDLPLPVWFTEILSPIWTIDFLSVDNVFLANAGLREALLSALATSPLGHVAVCSGLYQKLEELGLNFSLQGLLDPDFVCVGVWGYGYPRMGIVRNDDPLVSHLLASARFHHLYSKTIPVIPFEFSYEKIRYQLVRPFSTECMRPGCGGTPIPSLCEILQNATNPTELFNLLKDKAVGTVGRTMNALDRKTFLVVWKQNKKCCGC